MRIPRSIKSLSGTLLCDICWYHRYISLPGANCDPVHHKRPPQTPTMKTTTADLSTARGGRVKSGGPIVASRAVVTVSVNKMEMPVLMATIWPNFAKGTMTQKKSGMVEITVVTALDTIATPTWFAASMDRRCRLMDDSCKVKKMDGKLWKLLMCNISRDGWNLMKR